LSAKVSQSSSEKPRISNVGQSELIPGKEILKGISREAQTDDVPVITRDQFAIGRNAFAPN